MFRELTNFVGLLHERHLFESFLSKARSNQFSCAILLSLNPLFFSPFFHPQSTILPTLEIFNSLYLHNVQVFWRNTRLLCGTGLQVYMGTLSQKCVRQWPIEDPEQAVLWGTLRKAWTIIQKCSRTKEDKRLESVGGGGGGSPVRLGHHDWHARLVSSECFFSFFCMAVLLHERVKCPLSLFTCSERRMPRILHHIL